MPHRTSFRARSSRVRVRAAGSASRGRCPWGCGAWRTRGPGAGRGSDRTPPGLPVTRRGRCLRSTPRSSSRNHHCAPSAQYSLASVVALCRRPSFMIRRCRAGCRRSCSGGRSRAAVLRGAQGAGAALQGNARERDPVRTASRDHEERAGLGVRPDPRCAGGVTAACQESTFDGGGDGSPVGSLPVTPGQPMAPGRTHPMPLTLWRGP